MNSQTATISEPSNFMVQYTDVTKMQQEYLHQPLGVETSGHGQAAIVIDMAPNQMSVDKQDTDTVQNYKRNDSKASKPSTSGSNNVLINN
jgi:hypothetical protein